MKWPVPLPTNSVDAFTYYGNWPHWPVPDNSETAMLRQMDRLGIESAVVLSLGAAFGDPQIGNRDLAAAVKRHADRLLGLVTYDPRQHETPRQVLESGRDAGLRGLALFPGQHGYQVHDEPSVGEALSCAEEFHWPVVIPIRVIMSWWMPETTAASVVAAIRRHPGVPFVVASLSYGELHHILSAMRALTNLRIEISGTQSLDALARMVEAGGRERILFGSGQPVQMPECSLIKVATAPLDDETKRMILHDNAHRLFRL